MALSCQSKNEAKQKDGKGDQIINNAIQTHGGSLYDSAYYQFTFRNKTYQFKNSGTSYRYEVNSLNEEDAIKDIIEDGSYTRTINNEPIDLDEKSRKKYFEALNSVIYFATLPHKLNDPAVLKSYKGKTTIKGENYDLVEVTFQQEGGGIDHEDQYFYWVHSSKNTVDYLAYNYKVNNGGVRFRSSYNRRKVDGIIFQDYINYKAKVGTPPDPLGVNQVL